MILISWYVVLFDRYRLEENVVYLRLIVRVFIVHMIRKSSIVKAARECMNKLTDQLKKSGGDNSRCFLAGAGMLDRLGDWLVFLSKEWRWLMKRVWCSAVQAAVNECGE